MALSWHELDLRADLDEPWFQTDPSEMVDALGYFLAMAERPEWHARAACRGKGPTDWFPTQGSDLTPARTVCASCSVQAECLEAGRSEAHGVWSGLSAKQRRQVRRAA